MSALLLPKPIRPVKVLKPLRRGAPLKRGKRPIKTRRPVGTKRREAKAAGYVDPLTWAAICAFYENEHGVVMCAYGCGRPGTEMDHVHPLSKGGLHCPANVVPCDTGCNQKKGTQTWEPVARHPFMDEPGETAKCCEGCC
jgi:hypothetical protein